MCGIAGVFRFSGSVTAEDVSGVLRMLDAQIHRGPDDWGLLVPSVATREPELRALLERLDPVHVRTYPSNAQAPAIVLGSRRLSIIDRSPRGRMPMGTDDGTRWIALNGEIYNHREIRAVLAGRTTFRSDADSEALLHGFDAWGDTVPERLRGMFAFALFETRPRPRLLLGRDRFGIKPMYISADRARLVFASEVGAVLRSGMVPSETNPEALRRFLELGSVPAPLTTMRDVQALPAGEIARVDAAGLRMVRYWDLGGTVATARESAPLTREDAVDATRTLLEESVRLHLVADVPVGAFLSGGIDSAGIVALAAPRLDRPLATLTLTFDDAHASEARYARLVAEQYGTDHREVHLDAGEVFGALPRVFAAMDQPTVDGVNTWCVSRAAREAGLPVVLSGVGADEIFWGYRHVRRAGTLAGLCRLMTALPPGARRGLARLASATAPAIRPGFDRAAYLETPAPASPYRFVRGLFPPAQASALLGHALGESGPAAGEPVDDTRASFRDTLAALDMRHYLRDQLLRDGDLMSMAHSVELRVPYLDHRLVERVLSLPGRFKLDRRRPKPLLLDALGGRIPREVWDRPKMGFTLPMARWMRERARELRAACHEEKLLDRQAVDHVWDGFGRGRQHWSRPWALYVLSQLGAGMKGGVSCAR